LKIQKQVWIFVPKSFLIPAIIRHSESRYADNE